MNEPKPQWITAPTHWHATIYMAGDVSVAAQVCREECMRAGLCVTIEPCEYIYTGGQETWFSVRLINYPRFPSSPSAITARAKALAELLIKRTCQWSALVITPNHTEWLTTRPAP